MINFLAHGFMLGLAYVAPIGMQNLYVINTTTTKGKMRAYQVASIIIFFDISLAIACFLGMGLLMSKSELIKSIVLLIGSMTVIYIGVGLIRSKAQSNREVDVNKTLVQVTATCFAVTWLNPQALIDGSLLLGGFRASLPVGASRLFILGVCLASFTWFMGLTTIVSIFKNRFNSKVVRWINIICGGVIIYYGFKLGYTFIQSIL